jgi:nucleotide-binding universal stress UspA family protein
MKNLEAETVTNQSVSIKKILVAVDLSDFSEATVSYAAGIAEYFDASLTIVHVHEPVALYECASETTYTLLDDQRRDLFKRLDELKQQARQSGLVCESVYLTGDAAEQISDLARDIDADLIVTASHHPSFLGRLFNLEKAPRIMRQAHCPVMIYHQTGKHHATARQSRIQKLQHGTAAPVLDR